jgi:hypothetical protein
MSWHLIWLWFWYFLGLSVFMLKRAYFGVYVGPSPMGTSYANYFQRCWAPLLVRFFWDSLIFWACFTPQLLTEGLSLLGWSSLSGGLAVITKFAPCAAGFGYIVDSILDTVAAIAGKHVSFLNGLLPPLPPPLPQQAVVQAAIVEQKVTQLQTTTTIVPSGEKPLERFRET